MLRHVHHLIVPRFNWKKKSQIPLGSSAYQKLSAITLQFAKPFDSPDTVPCQVNKY
ncbi:Protein of unknown function [Pyronema omphalodes CBS 100304]|uniref:Uncharacterized protein n=1 Tax=Pyronema omphalodes (strain CBS 100304) TaxID=1076935 RepID=U4LH96_PYROM|nr:Protein of unknown function [Pyronema omphalodes CBS 100304]